MASKKIEKQEDLFTKEQILASKRYSTRRDVLGAILADDKEYTFEQVDSLLKRFMERKVK